MTETIFEILAIISLLFGLFFMLVGAVGVVRMPDMYLRMHAMSKCSTLGLLGLLLAAVFHLGTLGVATKAAMTILFAFVATPVGSHILAKAALHDRAPQWPGTLSDEHREHPPAAGPLKDPPSPTSPGAGKPDAFHATAAQPPHAASGRA